MKDPDFGGGRSKKTTMKCWKGNKGSGEHVATPSRENRELQIPEITLQVATVSR